MERSLEQQFRATIEESSANIVAEDPKVQEIVAWVLGKETALEFTDDPDFNELLTYFNDRYGLNAHILDRAMVICEQQIIRQEAYEDPDLQRAARRTFFMYGEPGRQVWEDYFKLAQEKGLTEEEARDLIANIKTDSDEAES